MQLSPASRLAQAPNASPPSTAELTAQRIMPRELQVARIGTGTVRSEIDRSIRVRLEGDGPTSSRAIVADSKAAADLLASEHGDAFVGAIRSALTVTDPHVGKENLRSITLLPDEHASKGIAVLNWADQMTRSGTDLDALLEPTEEQVAPLQALIPSLTREQITDQMRRLQAAEATKLIAAPEAEDVAFSAAWNVDGHVVVMPDVSRELLSTIGLYRIQPGDEATKLPPAARTAIGRDAWHTVIHEAHHSVTPMVGRTDEWRSVMEEAIPEVLTPQAMAPVMRRAGADAARSARPARDTAREAVDWAAWNRAHLPAPPASEVATAEGRYVDGPELVRDLLKLAGIDRRTREGKAAALDILQGEAAEHVPDRIADAIVAGRDLAPDVAPQVADLIRRAAVGDASLVDISHLIER